MVTLCILDGFGVTDKTLGNAIAAAGTPNLDKLLNEYPNTLISAAGESVGLPEGQMGNSEVGHLTIGAGRVIEQDLLHIDNEIKRGDFANNEALNKALKYAEENGTDLHLLGLASDGGIHSRLSHMYAILDVAKNYNIKNIYIHPITDGRDTSVDAGIRFLAEIDEKIQGTNAKIDLVEITGDQFMLANSYHVNTFIDYFEEKFDYDQLVYECVSNIETITIDANVKEESEIDIFF